MLGLKPEIDEFFSIRSEVENRGRLTILTGKKAVPFGMKFTLFLSGQENKGTELGGRDLVESKVINELNEGDVPFLVPQNLAHCCS